MTQPDTYMELFYAYLAVWVIIAVFLMSLSSKVTRLEKRSSKFTSND